MSRQIIRDKSYHKAVAEQYVNKLSLEEKLIAMSASSDELAAIGLPRFHVGGEAAHGVQARHDQNFDLGTPVYTTVFPNPIGMAASWDKELMYEIGNVTGVEARSLYNEGLNGSLCMWAPTVDMERDPRWGRNEEAYGEDPHLTSRMAGEYIRGMAGEDERYVRCGATLKHFYANNVEEERSNSDSIIPEKLKEEYYLRVFREIIEYADPMAAMSSYNLVNGVPSTFNSEIREKLKKWGLTHVTCDAGALSFSISRQHKAENEAEAIAKSLHAGVDNFPDNPEMIDRAVREAYSKGLITEEDITQALINIMTAYSMLGLMEGQTPFSKDEYNIQKVDTALSRRLARQAAAESVVMLKCSERQKEGEMQQFLLVGPFADRCPLDWYSGVSSHSVTVREGIGDACITEELFPYVRIRLADDDNGKPSYAGIRDCRLTSVPDQEAEIFRLMLWDESRITIRSVSTGKLLTTRRPDQRIMNSEELADSFILYATAEEAFSWFVHEAFELYDNAGDPVIFTPDNALHFWEDTRICGIRNHDGARKMSFETVRTPEMLLESVGKECSKNHVPKVVACFGLHPMVNCKEERDRKSIELPPYQRSLLRLLRSVCSEITLVLLANAPVAIAEEHNAEEVKSIYWSAFGSEELGNGIADIIYGRMSPAGRLPQTWYKNDAQLADINDYDIRKNHMTYLYMQEEPLYRFGYGLTASKIEQSLYTEQGKLYVTLRNVGDCCTDDVIQIYQEPETAVTDIGTAQPVYHLFGEVMPAESRLIYFARIKAIKPQEERCIEIELPVL